VSKPRSEPTLFLTYLPVALLILFAILQIDRVYREEQTPWKGGGFGMFSTNDRGNLRTVRAVAIVGELERAIPPGITTRRRFRAITSMPREERLLELARELAAKPANGNADAIRVEIYKTRFDSSTATARVEKVTEATYRRRNSP
jgi:hypothetical protein